MLEKTEKTNQLWTIQRHRQHWIHKTQDEDKQNKSTKQKTKKMSNTDPHQKPRLNQGAGEE